MKSRWVFRSISPSKNPLNVCAEASSAYVLNHVGISHLLSVSSRQSSVLLGSSLHASIIKNHEFSCLDDEFQRHNAVVIWNSLLSNYVKWGSSSDAVKLFDRMPLRDTISWNIMVSSFLRDNRDFEMGFRYLKQMMASDVCKVDHATLTTILSVCDGPEFSCMTKMIHCLVILYGFNRGISVANALITSYCKCERWPFGKLIFDEMLERNVISWTAIISGLAQNDICEASLRLFAEMHSRSSVNPNTLTYLGSLLACSGLQAVKEGNQIHGMIWKIGIQSDLCIESALMDMYSKCGSLEDAWRIFVSAEDLDEVSLTVILAGFAQNGYEEEAIHLFMKMMKQGLEIDPNVVSTVLGVFSENTSLKLGQQIHSLIVKKNFSCNQFVGNGLINMYSKCGDMEESIKIFRRMSLRSQITWNSMIAAFARHGNGFEALEMYEKMVLEGTKPTDVTFLSLLHACSHVGLVKQGLEYLKSMIKDHGLSPRTEHYACIVDMLGRAGHLSEARNFIEGLPKDPDLHVWQALLGACSIHGDSKMGKYAADKLLSDSPASPSPYVLLANIYSSEENWRERARALRRMKDVGISKEVGTSWIEIEKKVHTFVVYDRSHPQGEAINGVLVELFKLMTDEGYVPEKKLTSNYADEEGIFLPSVCV